MPNPSQLDLSPIAPNFSASPQEKVAWLLGSWQRGESNLKNGDAYKSINQTIDIIAGRIFNHIQRTNADSKGKRRSDVSINRIKRQLREIIALLSQRIKPNCDFKTSNAAWEEVAYIFTKRFKSWMHMNLFDRTLKDWLIWASIASGYLHVGWSKPIPGRMDTDLFVEVLGPDDVVRDQGTDFLTAYSTTIRKTYNLAEAINLFPLSRNYLIPLRTKSSVRAQDARKVSGWLSPLLNAVGFTSTGQPSAGDSVNSYGFLGTDVEIFYTYVLDQRINQTGKPLHSDDITYDMATGIKTKSTTWEYTIPSLGDPIPLDSTGQHFDIATQDKAMLYPTRRLLIWTQDHLIYDGPSWYWHGRPPVVQLSLDKWPWEQIGYSLAMDNISMGQAVNSIIRGIVDSFDLTFDPPIVYNSKEINPKEMDKLDLRKPGARIARSGVLPNSEIISRILDGGYQIPQGSPEIMGQLMQLMDHQVGVADVSSLLELQQVPSADSTERLLQAQGPLSTDYARELERAITEFGFLAGWNFLQYDTMKKRLQILGQDGLSFTDWQHDPGNILPVEVPGVPKDSGIMQRGLVFGRQFTFLVVPNSIFEFTDTQDKLFKFQLWRDGRFPMDPQTLAESWNLGNFGEVLKGKTIMERWLEWQELAADQQARIQAKVQVLMQQYLLQAQLEMAQQNPQMAALMQLMQMAGGAEGQPGQPANGSNRPGRKPEGGKPPHLEQKASLSNMRNDTISES